MKINQKWIISWNILAYLMQDGKGNSHFLLITQE